MHTHTHPSSPTPGWFSPGWFARAAQPGLPVNTLIILLLLPLLLLLTQAGIALANEPCPNQQAREQNNSTQLPDCRAYEMVSPLNKNGGDINQNPIDNGGVIQATPDGTSITYPSLASFATPQGAPIVSQYLSTTTPQGWNTQNITQPTQSPEKANTDGTPYKAFDTNLTTSLLLNSTVQEAAIEEPPVGGAPAGYRDYYLHNLNTGTNQALLTTAPTEPPEEFNLLAKLYFEGYAATPDLHHIILNGEAPLLPGITPGRNLYEWSNGQLEAINLAPGATNNETLPEAKLGSIEGYQDRAISENGTRAFWSVGRSAEALYAREGIGTPTPRTIQVDESIGGGGDFLTASTDGSKVFFTKLTAGAPGDLYEYDLDDETLTDLTPSATPGVEEANIQGVLGASNDGSYVYFIASASLAPSAPTENCEPRNPASGCNLYLYHAGSPITYITTLTGADERGEILPGESSLAGRAHDWSEVFAFRTARVSADGRHAVFMSEAQLTPYDNHALQEVYEYSDEGAPGVACHPCITCVSCRPNGLGPTGPSSIPGATEYGYKFAVRAPRVLSSDGRRVFFNSLDAVIPTDTNNKQDVYEWEHPETGTCPPGPAGCTSLISTGASTEESSFADASENGDDVFFLTRQQLTPGDSDQETDLYDAHQNGGYTTPNPPLCTGTGCQGLPGTPPIFATPPTTTLEGNTNLPPPPKKKTTPRTLTRAQKLTHALKTCQKKPPKQRPTCKKAAHKLYNPPHKKKAKRASPKK